MDDAIFRPPRRKLDTGGDHRMAGAGILGEANRVELIDGGLIDMAPVGQGHAAIVNGLTRALVLGRAPRAD